MSCKLTLLTKVERVMLIKIHCRFVWEKFLLELSA
jgi:hypothetical protein